MTDPKPKQRKPKIELREPAKPLATPPEPRLLPSDHPVMEIFRQAQAADTYHPPPTTQPPIARPIAPERDFVRVPNSVVRDALPAGLFKGESKKTYDALYQRTRGAVVPCRCVRATLAEVMAWANVSHNTLKAHLKHLALVGLLKIHYVRGDNTGAEYEVFTPEEAPPTTHHPETTHQPPTNQNVGPPTSQNLVLGGGGQVIDKAMTSDDPKTSFKTNTEKTDDEAFAGLRAAVKEATGKDVSASSFRELDELLATEFRIAAGRTELISSGPAFITEHLRRRLWKKEKAQLDREAGNTSSAATQSQPKLDASKCPDCFGTGMYYPEGYEKGVAKCRHETLMPTEGNER